MRLIEITSSNGFTCLVNADRVCLVTPYPYIDGDKAKACFIHFGDCGDEDGMIVGMSVRKFRSILESP